MGINLDETSLTQEEFAGNYQRYHDEVYAHILRVIKDRDAAEDLAHDSFRKALEKINIYNGSGFRSWIHAIARNAALDYIRAKKTRTEFSNGARSNINKYAASTQAEKNQASFLGGIEYSLGIHGSDPERETMVREQLAAVIGFIDAELSDEQRDAYTLHLQGYSGREVGERIGIKEEAATLRIFRARKKIREYASEHLKE